MLTMIIVGAISLALHTFALLLAVVAGIAFKRAQLFKERHRAAFLERKKFAATILLFATVVASAAWLLALTTYNL